MNERKLIFEQSVPGRRAYSWPEPDVPVRAVDELVPPRHLRQAPPNLPEVSELEVVRHFVGLSQLNHAIEKDFYPLGSCTMKYNPRVNEDVARLPGIGHAHPMQDPATVQGNLALLWHLEQQLCAVTGMDRFTFQPAAGAHGELTGILLLRAYHLARGETQRKQVIVPDSAHGTNPATAAMAGYEVVSVARNAAGDVDLDALRALVGPETAGLMMTNPSTLGLFDSNILAVAEIVHAAGGLLYYDGANMNAILGYARPGDMGFDIVHLNLHKTFATPHGGGGPGSGPVGVKAALAPYLPVPLVARVGEDRYDLDWDRPQSIGKVHGFGGNFGVVARAYAYALACGRELQAVSECAVLNANYLLARLRDTFDLPYDRHCMHEFVLAGRSLKRETGVRTLDVAKRLLDYGMHAPTIYFPLVIEEAIMIEPTETEPKETLDRFVAALQAIVEEARTDPETVKGAPHTTPVGRLDEAQAARKPNLRWRPPGAPAPG